MDTFRVDIDAELREFFDNRPARAGRRIRQKHVGDGPSLQPVNEFDGACDGGIALVQHAVDVDQYSTGFIHRKTFRCSLRL
jgi:hypothetical protein